MHLGLILFLFVQFFGQLFYCQAGGCTKSLPEKFDARVKWPKCASIRAIKHQGQCNSCWAISAVQVMTDRYCIHSKMGEEFHFSAYDVISCARNHGCSETDSLGAWTFWVNRGIVSENCKPYPYSSLKSDSNMNTHKCVKKCRNNYDMKYKADKSYGKEIYVMDNNETEIMEEIFLNGPVQATFNFYEDLNNFTTGIYEHYGDESLTWHAVRIIGWGVENGVKYWLCANSWGTEWGDDGFFKIPRGVNHCSIESKVLAGMPHFRNHSMPDSELQLA